MGHLVVFMITTTPLIPTLHEALGYILTYTSILCLSSSLNVEDLHNSLIAFPTFRRPHQQPNIVACLAAVVCIASLFLPTEGDPSAAAAPGGKGEADSGSLFRNYPFSLPFNAGSSFLCLFSSTFCSFFLLINYVG